jgi:D-alanyl-D-alanine carboxypeptidase
MLSLLVILSSTTAFGDPAIIPDTPIGKIYAAWMSAYNAANEQKLLDFKTAYQREWEVRDILDWREQTGGFKVLRIEKSEPLALSAIVQERDSDQAWLYDSSMPSAGSPINLNEHIQPTELPADLAIPRLSQADALRALTVKADSLARDDRFSGALLIAHKGKVLLKRAWGYANRELKVPNTPDTQFRLGSINKMFTAMATLQLIDAGKMSLDGLVGKYILDYPNKIVASKVTVRHLLTHTGGMGDIFGPEWAKEPGKFRVNRDYVKLYGSRAPDQEPGSKFRYSNYGFALLGALIEKVSGLSYYDYVDGHIFEPSGMTRTASLPESVNVPDRARGYMKQNGAWVSNAGTLPHRGMAAGGGYSTVADLLLFAEALESGKLLPKALFTEATTRFFQDESFSFGYGYGFMVSGHGALSSYGHDGGAPGMNTRFRVYPRLGYVLIGLSNQDPPEAERLIGYFANRMPATP